MIPALTVVSSPKQQRPCSPTLLLQEECLVPTRWLTSAKTTLSTVVAAVAAIEAASQVVSKRKRSGMHQQTACMLLLLLQEEWQPANKQCINLQTVVNG
jgi:hypothetical protein